MNRPEWSRRQFLAALSGVGSLSALTVRYGWAQEPNFVTVDNQYRIKARLLYLLPDFMTWDVLEKQKGDLWIGIITHGDTKTDFREEINSEKHQQTPSGRKINWRFYNSAEDLIKASSAKGAPWHLIFVTRKTDDVVLTTLTRLNQRFGGRQGVVLVTEENTQFRLLAAINFWEDAKANRIGMQLRHKYLGTSIGVTPKKEMLAVDGVTLYDNPPPRPTAQAP